MKKPQTDGNQFRIDGVAKLARLTITEQRRTHHPNDVLGNQVSIKRSESSLANNSRQNPWER